MPISIYLIENAEELSRSPELGPGYQFCRVQGRQTGAERRHLIVFNQTFGVDLEGYNAIPHSDKQFCHALKAVFDL